MGKKLRKIQTFNERFGTFRPIPYESPKITQYSQSTPNGMAGTFVPANKTIDPDDPIKVEYPRFLRNFVEFEEEVSTENEILQDFNQQETTSYNGLIYHGTPIGKLKSILNNGIYEQPHRELRFDSFSTSVNDNMINHFGNGSGLVFSIDFKNILVMNDFYYKLFAYESGVENISSEEDIEKAEKLGLKDRFGDYGIGNADEFLDKYYHNNPKYRNSEGIVFEDINKYRHNAELEIIITKQGIGSLMNNLIGVYIDDSWYDVNNEEDRQDVLEMLKDVEEQDAWDEE